MQQIFISYAQDQAHGQRLAEQVQQQLHAQGFAVFRDVSGVIPGTKWAHEIERQLKASKLLVLVVSAKALDSDWVFAEFDMAKEYQIPIIPVFAELLSAPLWLRHLQRLDFSGQPDWERLMQAVSSHIPLSKPPSSTSIIIPAVVKQPELSWVSATGDDQYGRYADVDVKGIIQRFRWIKPGKFLMGSPASEPVRRDREIQHEVTLTQCFWLADTACTQALWRVVMGSNPAYFQDNPNNPVEQVSWDDAQGFAKKLNGMVSGLKVRLPSEAEWEYACRAGTTTRYSFGNEITAKQVSFNKNEGKTVPVKSLPANAWGLYEMHGNVWEWCQDRFGSYPVEPVIKRVVRGGSWSNDGGYVRSAIRSRNVSDYRSDFIGIRLAIGHS